VEERERMGRQRERMGRPPKVPRVPNQARGAVLQVRRARDERGVHLVDTILLVSGPNQLASREHVANIRQEPQGVQESPVPLGRGHALRGAERSGPQLRGAGHKPVSGRPQFERVRQHRPVRLDNEVCNKTVGLTELFLNKRNES